MCTGVIERERLQSLLTLDAHEAAGNTQQLIKYLQLHLIQDFVQRFLLWPRAEGCRLHLHQTSFYQHLHQLVSVRL